VKGAVESILNKAKRKPPNGRKATLFQRVSGEVKRYRVLVLAFDQSPKRCRVRLLTDAWIGGRWLKAGMMPMVPRSAIKFGGAPDTKGGT